MWNCERCGENCEEQFDLCWKCERPRARVTAELAPPPLPQLPPTAPCEACGSERVISGLPVRGLEDPARLCAACGRLELSASQLLQLWENWVLAHTPSLEPERAPPIALAEEWRETVLPARGARVVVEAGGGDFDAWLPLSGQATEEYEDAAGGAGWLLLELDEPISPTLRTGVSQRYLRLQVAALLVQADLGAGRDPRAWKRVKATLIPLEAARRPSGPVIAAADHPHAFRALCSAAPARAKRI